MAPKNRFVSEYKANFKPHEIRLALEKQQQIQNQKRILPPEPIKESDKRTVDRKPEKPKQKENHALRYKAGLVPSMPAQNKIRYLSEYRKQFEWKRPLGREAPILSAEKMIYGGQDGNPSRATKLNLPKKTEYQLQFVEHPLVSSPEVKEKDKGQNSPDMYSPVGYQDAQVPAGKPSKKSPPPIITRKSVVFQSEYHANFKSPTKYDYVKGSWVGADPPQLHPPDEQSNEGRKPISNTWYQQVLELREKVRNYRSRAREGSHFLSLLKNLQKYEKEAQKEDNKQVNIQDPATLPGHHETPRSETSRKSTPVKTSSRQEDAPRGPKPEDAMTNDKQQAEQKEPTSIPASPGRAETAENDKLYWDKRHTLPGPPLKKIHSLETMSHESTITNGTSTNTPGENPPVDGPRRAWPEKKAGNRTHIIPPYHTSESSNGVLDDTRSDVTISDIELSNVDNQEVPYKPVQATRKLFTGKRADVGDVREDNGDDRHYIGDDREYIGDDREYIGDDRYFAGDRKIIVNDRDNKPVQATRKLFTGKRQDVDDGREDNGVDRKYIGDDRYFREGRRDIVDVRKQIGDDGERISSFSSDDEMSCISFKSQSSSVLSVEAMHKRRALASETLQRAKRRQAQL